jgi:hypothetical protein
MSVNQELQTTMKSQVEAWKTSGLTQIAYCREQGIIFSQFNYWVRKLCRSPESARGFVKIKLKTESAPLSNGPVMELVLPGGARLNFYQPVDPDYLKRLLY